MLTCKTRTHVPCNHQLISQKSRGTAKEWCWKEEKYGYMAQNVAQITHISHIFNIQPTYLTDTRVSKITPIKFSLGISGYTLSIFPIFLYLPSCLTPPRTKVICYWMVGLQRELRPKRTLCFISYLMVSIYFRVNCSKIYSLFEILTNAWQSNFRVLFVRRSCHLQKRHYTTRTPEEELNLWSTPIGNFRLTLCTFLHYSVLIRNWKNVLKNILILNSFFFFFVKIISISSINKWHKICNLKKNTVKNGSLMIILSKISKFWRYFNQAWIMR